jgi:hypothetical protein
VTQYNNVEVEATREVEVDVTRLVEVAAEVEVTRKVEVTRIVEQPVEIDEQLPVVYSGEFPRLAFDTVMPTGQSVAVECQDSNADYPYSPYDWPDATAMLEIRQGASRSTVAMEVSAARPNTYYTTWLRLKGEDANGVAYGGNPLMGIPGTPLIPSSELGNALETFSEPDDTSINGFYTDENGNASFYIELDFPIINGAYPFQGFAGFDAADERFLLDEPSIPPVAIAMSGVPFTLRIASHCMDGKGHGLMPGPHEGWFDWTLS